MVLDVQLYLLEKHNENVIDGTKKNNWLVENQLKVKYVYKYNL